MHHTWVRFAAGRGWETTDPVCDWTPFWFHDFQLSSNLLPAVFHSIFLLGVSWTIAGSSGTPKGDQPQTRSVVSQPRFCSNFGSCHTSHSTFLTKNKKGGATEWEQTASYTGLLYGKLGNKSRRAIQVGGQYVGHVHSKL